MRSTVVAFLLCVPTFVAASTITPLAPLQDHLRFVGKDGENPIGKRIKLGRNVTTYVSKPKLGSYAKDTAIVVLTDVFGIAERNNLLLTDHFAAAGFQTYTPDYLFGDPVKPSQIADPTFDWDAWRARHDEARTTPALLSVISDLKKQGIKKIGVSGYCFGGLYATRLAQNNTVAVSSMTHPSLIQVPDDFVKLNTVGKTPVQVITAELDMVVTPALAGEIDATMSGYAPGYSRVHFTGVGHSFAIDNATSIVAVAAKEAAFQSGLTWIKTALKMV